MSQQDKHQRLVRVLNQQFGYNFQEQKKLHTGGVLDINRNDINKAIQLFCDALNINSGSFGSRDLYDLLYKYLTDKEKQEAINNAK